MSRTAPFHTCKCIPYLKSPPQSGRIQAMQIFQDFNSTATLPSFSGVVLVTSLQALVYLINFQRNESTRLTWLAAWAPPLSVTKHSDSASKARDSIIRRLLTVRAKKAQRVACRVYGQQRCLHRIWNDRRLLKNGSIVRGESIISCGDGSRRQPQQRQCARSTNGGLQLHAGPEGNVDCKYPPA